MGRRSGGRVGYIELDTQGFSVVEQLYLGEKVWSEGEGGQEHRGRGVHPRRQFNAHQLNQQHQSL